MAAAQAKFSGGYDARNAEFWNEMEERANKARLKWFAKNYDMLYEKTRADKIPSQAKQIMKELTDLRIERLQNSPHLVVKKRGFPPIPEPDLTVNMKYMKPVEPEVRDILYHGISRNGEGRAKYLEERYKKLPEDRYYFPETTSFLYGWQCEELKELLNQEPRRGKVAIVKDSFYSQTNTEHDNERNRPPLTGYCSFEGL